MRDTFLKRILIVAFLILSSKDLFADSLSCTSSTVKVHFINGMFNSHDDVLTSKSELSKIFEIDQLNSNRLSWPPEKGVSIEYSECSCW